MFAPDNEGIDAEGHVILMRRPGTFHSRHCFVLPLQADGFDDGREWSAIFSRNLGDVLGL